MKLSRTDWLFALLLCVLLQFAWGAQDWANLRQLRLPDTDDMVRLQQIRDWLNGQSWFDLTQHRLGPGDGLPMHWTRVNDLIPALIITLVRPLAGVHSAELAAVLIGPALLFFAFLMLSGRAALSLAGSASNQADVAKIAMIIAAFAFPATGMFIPGRIDHHALQIVLLLGAVTAALSCSGAGRSPELQSNETPAEARLRPAPEHRSSVIGGMFAGAACALSIVVGLETVPQIMALFTGLLVAFIIIKDRNDTLFIVFWCFVTTLFAGYFIFSPNGLNDCQCDSVGVPIVGCAIFPVMLLSLLLRKMTGNRQHPSIVMIAVAALTIMAFGYATPVCRLGPYGQVDPFLMRVWMAHVGEAQGLFHQSSFGIVWGYSALVLVALAVAIYVMVFLRKQESSSKLTTGLLPPQEHRSAIINIDQHMIKYLIIAAPLGMSVLVMLFQLRGAYIGAGLAAPILGVWVSRLRVRGPMALVGGALLSAGVVHHVLADKFDALLARTQPAASPAIQASLGKSSGGAGCTDAATMAALNQLPASTIMAPMDAGAYIIGATPHHVFAAPYHRNNAGNLAMYDFFLATPDAAAVQARTLQLDYVLICPDSFSELKDESGLANSLVVALKSGHAPKWLIPSALGGSSAMLFRVGVK